MGSSLPNHDGKEQKGQTKKRLKTKQEKPRADYKLEQKKKKKRKRKISNYMMHEQYQHMMHALMQ